MGQSEAGQLLFLLVPLRLLERTGRPPRPQPEVAPENSPNHPPGRSLYGQPPAPAPVRPASDYEFAFSAQTPARAAVNPFPVANLGFWARFGPEQRLCNRPGCDIRFIHEDQ